MNRLKQRWSCDGGYHEVLKIAVPLILSTGAYSVQHFVDRMFLSWYSPEAIAAAMPAGILAFSLLCFFIGTASYVSTFVAQYFGAGQDENIGPIVWQGIYFSLSSLVFMLLVIPFADTIFEFAGHPPGVKELEIQYFVIVCLGGFFPVVSSAISGLFNGLGRTWTVMWVNIVATGVNIVLDYVMIFGKFGFPEWGIRGAAVATVVASIIGTLLFALLLLRPEYRKTYGTWRGRRFNRPLFHGLLKFGIPAGVQFFLDMMGFTLFILLVGRIGTIELAATNIAFNISMLCFMPMVGLGIAISVMVGQNMGNNNPEMAAFSTWSGTHISFLYMFIVAILFVAFPGLFLAPFARDADPASFKPIFDYGVVLLRFVALYTLFDTMNITLSSALKGAGDTRFVMIAMVTMSWLVMVIPTYLAIVVFKQHLFVAWMFATSYVVLLAFIFLVRFLNGNWKSMSVIRD